MEPSDAWQSLDDQRSRFRLVVLLISKALQVSAPGFDILLPLANAMTPPHNQPTPSSTKNSAALANKRMLLVEDNESIARTMLLLLTLLKIKVLHAGSGDEAYAILQHDQSFDAVLSDIQMPGSIDGHTLALKVRQEFPAIHVVLMTGFNDTGSEVPDFTLLQKPFNITQLTDCLAKLLLSRSPV